jgi:RNA-directed DNA polymerase
VEIKQSDKNSKSTFLTTKVKTTIGRFTNGVDFLGYQFGQEKITVSKRRLENHIRRLTPLYEQKKHLPNWKVLLDDYRQHWVTWLG